MEIQHVKFKIPIDGSGEVDLEVFIHVFHEWIRQQLCDELLIDVADYRHVDCGPFVLLVAHEADYAIDGARGQLGLSYSRKEVVDGDSQGRLAQALRAVLVASQRLEKEARFGGRLAFNRRELELTINDRALAPNDAASYAALEADLRPFLVGALGHEEFAMDHASAADPRELLRVRITSGTPYHLAAVAGRL